MRRAQKTHSWQRKQQPGPGASWFPMSPLIYGCDLPPVKVIARKYLRILKRLERGGEQLVRMNSKWYWMKGQRLLGTVKNAVIWALKDAKLIQGIGGRWLITTQGKAAVA